MENQDTTTATRLRDYIAFMRPWAHGHQLKARGDFVAAILERQGGCQAQLARGFGTQEAASKRLSRLLHNPRLEPWHLADAVLVQALPHLPRPGGGRLAIDWTIEGHQQLLVVSRVVGRRAVPIYWRAYDTSVLKGRLQRYELAVSRRALSRVTQVAGKRRGRVTADRGVAAAVCVVCHGAEAGGDSGYPAAVWPEEERERSAASSRLAASQAL